jgi:hypothetical protein
MRQDADVRHGDVNAYLDKHAPALGAGRRLPEFSAERKEQIERKIKEAQRGSTYHQHAQSDLDIPRDRFHAVNKAELVGGSDNPWPKLPEGSPWSGEHVDQYWGNRRAEEEAKRLGTVREAPVARGQFAEDLPYVVGSSAIPKYPPAGGQSDHSGKEPPLGSDNPALDSNPEPGMNTTAAARDTGGAAAPSSLPPCDVEPAPPSSRSDQTNKRRK